jgi:hypothetical protein
MILASSIDKIISTYFIILYFKNLRKEDAETNQRLLIITNPTIKHYFLFFLVKEAPIFRSAS